MKALQGAVLAGVLGVGMVVAIRDTAAARGIRAQRAAQLVK
jgi:hypothetical protein